MSNMKLLLILNLLCVPLALAAWLASVGWVSEWWPLGIGGAMGVGATVAMCIRW